MSEPSRLQVIDPENLILAIRNSCKESEFIYLNGMSWELYRILKVVFPSAEAYNNFEHIIIKIDRNFYDIRGLLTNKMIRLEEYKPIGKVWADPVGFWEERRKAPSIAKILEKIISENV